MSEEGSSKLRLLFATTNAGKLYELRQLAERAGLQLLSLSDVAPLEVEENGATLEENAEKKARAYVARYGLAALADDTGLFVDALDGAPGIYSARYAAPGETLPGAEQGGQTQDQRNRRKLLAALRGVVGEGRRAHFRTVLALALPGEPTLFAQGRCQGRISEEERGDGGFGYDPLFETQADGRTMAELTPAEKNALSHRGAAFRAVVPLLEALARRRPEAS